MLIEESASFAGFCLIKSRLTFDDCRLRWDLDASENARNDAQTQRKKSAPWKPLGRCRHFLGSSSRGRACKESLLVGAQCRIVLLYAKVGDMWLQTALEGNANVRFLGRHTVVFRDVKYELGEFAADVSSGQNRFLHGMRIEPGSHRNNRTGITAEKMVSSSRGVKTRHGQEREKIISRWKPAQKSAKALESENKTTRTTNGKSG